MCMMFIVLRAEGRHDRGSRRRQGFVAKKLRLTQGSFGEDEFYRVYFGRGIQ